VHDGGRENEEQRSAAHRGCQNPATEYLWVFGQAKNALLTDTCESG
jgi:hypothetical protein